MTKLVTLEKTRKAICVQLAHIASVAAEPKTAAGKTQFYDVLSYNCKTAEYKKYIAVLKEKTELTRQELKYLIVKELSCRYNFEIGTEFNFGAATPTKEKLEITRDRLLTAYFEEADYEKCLKIIENCPEVNKYEIVNKIKIKSLFWQGKFKTCSALITKDLNRNAPIAAKDKVFYLLQRALCGAKTGRLNKALMDCNSAWQAVQKPSEGGFRHRPTILWIRAHINQELGNWEKFINDLEELPRQNNKPPYDFLNTFTSVGENYFKQYQKLVIQQTN